MSLLKTFIDSFYSENKGAMISNKSNTDFYVSYEEATVSQIIDGDTIKAKVTYRAPGNLFSVTELEKTNGRIYRFAHIDTPETEKSYNRTVNGAITKNTSSEGQPIAEQATEMLETNIPIGTKLSILVIGIDTHTLRKNTDRSKMRFLAFLFTSPDDCINLKQVEYGLAISYLFQYTMRPNAAMYNKNYKFGKTNRNSMTTDIIKSLFGAAQNTATHNGRGIWHPYYRGGELAKWINGRSR